MNLLSWSKSANKPPHKPKNTMDKQTARDGSQTATHKRFQGYYLDYLLRFDSIGSYAAAYGLTYETAKHRIETAEKVHTSLVTSDIMAATGLACF